MSVGFGSALRLRAYRRVLAVAGLVALSLAAAGCNGDTSAAAPPNTPTADTMVRPQLIPAPANSGPTRL